ncbi:hypothetical protein ABS735_23500 [Streptomyces sp. MMCC 100]|uniref:hypothetical protein n=1 Tax=Streptomyces sp. MMCC 100 TaxID=3163555 RepID=UPI003597BFA7
MPSAKTDQAWAWMWSSPTRRPPRSCRWRRSPRRGRGVRVNAIFPGPVDTPGIANLFGGENTSSVQEKLYVDGGENQI